MGDFQRVQGRCAIRYGGYDGLKHCESVATAGTLGCAGIRTFRLVVEDGVASGCELIGCKTVQGGAPRSQDRDESRSVGQTRDGDTRRRTLSRCGLGAMKWIGRLSCRDAEVRKMRSRLAGGSSGG